MKTLMLILLLLTHSAQADYGPYPAKVTRVIDGDTIDVTLIIYPGLSQDARIRISGIDAPETRTRLACEKALGLESKSRLSQIIVNSSNITVLIYGVDSFGRQIALVYADGISIGETLLAEGYAKEYPFKGLWC